MKTLLPFLSSALLAVSLAACNKPETPQKTEADVLKAAAEGQAKVNEAATDAMKEHVDAAAKAVESGKPLSESDMKNDVANLHKIDVATADANYKVAKEKCDALTGEAKSGCLKQADAAHEADLAQAKADEKAAKSAVESKPNT